MKHTKFLLTAVAAVIFVTFTNCCGNSTTEPQAEPADTLQAEQPTFLTAIEDYLSTEIGASYSKGDVCIPYYNVVYTDETDTSDIRVWGDWWVFNYNLVGDTLKTVSGGSHPGLFHVQKNGDNYVVTAFEQVEDGAGNEASARRIFGDYYESFHQINSNADEREAQRANDIAEYVKKHGLKATVYQDYGWPVVPLKLD